MFVIFNLDGVILKSETKGSLWQYQIQNVMCHLWWHGIFLNMLLLSNS